jgi:hypothetical protein
MFLHKPSDASDATLTQILIFLIPNYLIFIIPHSIWLIAVKLKQIPDVCAHAGFIGANLCLLLFEIYVQFFVKDYCGMEWLFYFPLAALMIPFSSLIGLFFLKDF